MGDKEILAELKRSYEYLQDIIDNADKEQLKSVEELEKVQEILDDTYTEVFKKIKKENEKSLYYKENIRIAGDIYMDCYDNNGIPVSSGDMDWQKWWRDDSFIREF